MSEFTIEKDIPVPKMTSVGRKMKYPFESMQVGDSFFVKDGTVKSLSCSCLHHGKRLERKFASLTVDGGARVWRVE